MHVRSSTNPLRRIVATTLFTASLAGSAFAQLLPEPRAAKPPAPLAGRMDAVLWDADVLWHAMHTVPLPGLHRLTRDFLVDRLSALGLDVSPSLEVLVEVVGSNDGLVFPENQDERQAVETEVAQVCELLTRHGATIGSTWMRRVSARVPVDELVRVARALPEGYRVRVSSRPVWPAKVRGSRPSSATPGTC